MKAYLTKEQRKENRRATVKRWRDKNIEHVRKKNRESTARRRLRNPELDKARKQRDILNNPDSYLLRSSRGGAKTRGIEFSIVKEDIKIPEICPLLNIPLFITFGEGYNPNCPSVDRIDNSKGYTKDNIWVISTRANRLKTDSTLEELDLLVRRWKENVEQERD